MSLIKKLCKFYEKDKVLPTYDNALPSLSLRNNDFYLVPQVKLISGNARIASLLRQNETYLREINKEFPSFAESRDTSFDRTFLLKLVEKLYLDNNVELETVEQKKKNKEEGKVGYVGKKKTYYEDLPKIFKYNEGNLVDTKKKSTSMSLETAVDFCSALNKFCNFFYEDGKTKDSYKTPKDAFNAFLKKYKEIIRVFVRSRGLSYYPRNVEDIIATYCIFNCRTVVTYNKIYDELTGYFKKVNEEHGNSVEDNPQKEKAKNRFDKQFQHFRVYNTVQPVNSLIDTPVIRENIFNYISLNEDKFIKKLIKILEENPNNFQIYRYKETIMGCLKYFHDKKLIDKTFMQEIIQDLFNAKGKKNGSLPFKTRMALLSQVLNTDDEMDDCVDLFAILNENKQISFAEATVAFLRSLIILHYYQNINIKDLKVGETVEDKMKITLEKVNDKLTSLWLAPITYDRNTATKWFEFDWGFGRMVENELAK